jgi:hypothetical protein
LCSFLDGGQLSLAVHLSLLASKNLPRSRLKPVSQLWQAFSTGLDGKKETVQFELQPVSPPSPPSGDIGRDLLDSLCGVRDNSYRRIVSIPLTSLEELTYS